MNRASWLAIVVGAQAALLLAWAGYHEWNRGTAPTILLETVPVDPRDLLRGDYMILSYKISQVPRPPGVAGETDPGTAIWVSLRHNGRFHEVASTAWAAPEGSGAAGVAVRGRVHGERATGDMLRVDYGIEKYFVPEGKGQPRFDEMIVEATVSRSGRLGIKRLLLDGRSYP